MVAGYTSDAPEAEAYPAATGDRAIRMNDRDQLAVGHCGADSVFTVLSCSPGQNPDYDNKTAVEMLEAGDIKTVVAEARVFLKHGG